ncbi:hypothetical protein [Escherichia coli]|uniref:hypothetical protein n=1 Tax=Escherichia coli TaxID=562 RepID=UPI0020CF6289|nr:hypothetical protein [Escherichia coli]MCQ0130424.1 hypothetical protein [Escherichia coli]
MSASDCCRRVGSAWVKGCRGVGSRRHFVALRNESDAQVRWIVPSRGCKALRQCRPQPERV